MRTRCVPPRSRQDKRYCAPPKTRPRAAAVQSKRPRRAVETRKVRAPRKKSRTLRQREMAPLLRGELDEHARTLCAASGALRPAALPSSERLHHQTVMRARSRARSRAHSHAAARTCARHHRPHRQPPACVARVPTPRAVRNATTTYKCRRVPTCSRGWVARMCACRARSRRSSDALDARGLRERALGYARVGSDGSGHHRYAGRC